MKSNSLYSCNNNRAFLCLKKLLYQYQFGKRRESILPPSCYISSCPVFSHPVPFNPIWSHSVPSFSTLSEPSKANPIMLRPVPSRTVQFRPAFRPSCSVLSHPLQLIYVFSSHSIPYRPILSRCVSTRFVMF